MKVNLWKTKAIVSSAITKDDMFKSIAYPCGVCNLRVKAISYSHLQCGKWIHGRCARTKRVTTKFSINRTCSQ